MQKKTWSSLVRLWKTFASAVVFAGLTACGGGGSGGNSEVVTQPSAPVITTQPAAGSVVAPTPATFTVVATGTPTLAYQWQVSNDIGTTYTDITGATGASYTLSPTSTADSGKVLRVLVSNTAGQVFSTGAVLSVASAAIAPTFTLQPLSQSVTAPATATFTVGTSGSPTPTLQWQISSDSGITFTNIVGATTSSYTTPATGAVDNGKQFRAVASNSAGSMTSNAATLQVGPATTRQRFVYATYFENGNNTISGFALDVATGALAPTPSSPYTTGRSPSLVLHPSGDWLFATVVGGNAGTWVYRIDNATGRLTPVAGNPFATSFTPGSTPVVDPAGRYLAMVSGTGVAVYRFDTATGTLTSTGSLIFPIGASFVNFTSDSRFMFVRDGSGNLRTLATDPVAVGPSSIAPITPWSFSPVYVRGSRVVALLSNGSVVTMTVDTNDGRLAIVGSQQTGSTSSSIQLAATADPSCLLLSSREAGSSYRLLPVRIDPSNNSLSAGPELTVNGPNTTRGLMLHPTAAFGYMTGIAGSFTGIVTPLEIDSTPCTVAVNAGGNFSAVPDNQPVLFDSSGTLAIGAVAASAVLHVSRIDSVTRRVTPVAGSPFATPSPPTSIVLRE